MARTTIDYTPPKVQRGGLTNYRTNIGVPFLYNPAAIEEKKGVTWAEDPVPGTSDPLLRFASGKASVISFQLELCGESSIRRRGVQIINYASAQDENYVASELARASADPLGDGPQPSYSVDGEIEFFESFQFPTDPAEGGSGAPDLAVFTFGRRYPGVLVVVEDVAVNLTEFTPNLLTSRATLGITLKRYVIGSRTSSQYWR